MRFIRPRSTIHIHFTGLWARASLTLCASWPRYVSVDAGLSLLPLGEQDLGSRYVSLTLQAPGPAHIRPGLPFVC